MPKEIEQATGEDEPQHIVRLDGPAFVEVLGSITEAMSAMGLQLLEIDQRLQALERRAKPKGFRG